MLAASLALAAPAGLAVAAPAHAVEDPIPAALQRVEDGTYTEEDLDLLRSSEIADQVPDPTVAPTATVSTEREASDVQARAAGSCGWWVDVWFSKRSLVGTTIYKCHHRIVYCKTSSRITAWENRYDYLTEADSIVYVRARVVNQRSSTGSSSAWSHMQRHLEYCVVKYGCHANTYPWSKITVYAAGGYKYSGGAG